jgi:hypothetical protein
MKGIVTLLGISVLLAFPQQASACHHLGGRSVGNRRTHLMRPARPRGRLGGKGQDARVDEAIGANAAGQHVHQIAARQGAGRAVTMPRWSSRAGPSSPGSQCLLGIASHRLRRRSLSPGITRHSMNLLVSSERLSSASNARSRTSPETSSDTSRDQPSDALKATTQSAFEHCPLSKLGMMVSRSGARSFDTPQAVCGTMAPQSKCT